MMITEERRLEAGMVHEAAHLIVGRAYGLEMKMGPPDFLITEAGPRIAATYVLTRKRRSLLHRWVRFRFRSDKHARRIMNLAGSIAEFRVTPLKVHPEDEAIADLAFMSQEDRDGFGYDHVLTDDDLEEARRAVSDHWLEIINEAQKLLGVRYDHRLIRRARRLAAARA